MPSREHCGCWYLWYLLTGFLVTFDLVGDGSGCYYYYYCYSEYQRHCVWRRVVVAKVDFVVSTPMSHYRSAPP